MNKRKKRPKKQRYGPQIAIEPGSSPATLRNDAEAEKSEVRLLAYGLDEVHEEDIKEISELSRWLNRGPMMWIHVSGLGHAESIQRIGEIFGIHPLALEDIVNAGQQPKLEEYGENLFIVLQAADMAEHLQLSQIGIYVGRDFVLTFEEGTDQALERVRERIHKGRGRIRKAGAEYLTYAILDSVVDHYFPLLEKYGEQLEKIEDEVIASPAPVIMSQIHQVKREFLTLRRTLWPLREVMTRLMDEDLALMSRDMRPFLRDCHDHIIQAIDLVSAYREISASLSDMYLSSVSNRMNEVMKVLTIIATIFIPLTFVAGIYGMNFNPETSPWNMPELNWFWGYPLALFLMGVIAVILLIYFKRRKWL